MQEARFGCNMFLCYVLEVKSPQRNNIVEESLLLLEYEGKSLQCIASVIILMVIMNMFLSFVRPSKHLLTQI